MASRYSRKIPLTKAGTLTPSRLIPTMARSAAVRLRIADAIPAGIPMRTASRKAKTPRKMVTPIRLLMSDVTVCPLWIETPRFRWTAPLSQSRYWTKNESFRWYFASRAAMAAGLDGWVPRRTWIGFPGAR